MAQLGFAQEQNLMSDMSETMMTNNEASDYLVAPLDGRNLEEAVDRVLDERGQTLNLNGSAVELGYPTSNKRMLNIGAICRHVARTDVPVLILGESGVGKEVLARYIHRQSERRAPFVKVNCAALPAELLESELFGHDRGAFTGAQYEKPGKFELAGKGTIMLDEIAEMSPLLQAKLLHVLQDGEYTRLGGTRTRTSEARVLAATNKHLHTLVTKGAFSGRPLLSAQRYHYRSSASPGAARRYHRSL
jgi:two-component system response regulator AtoC